MTRHETALLESLKRLHASVEDAVSSLQRHGLRPYVCADLMQAVKKSGNAIMLAEGELKQDVPESGES
jgi:hypothetical protein